MNCPNCGESIEQGANFCEGCGSNLKPQETAGNPVDAKIECPQCHAGPACIDQAGFCTSCGTRRRADPRDHFQVVVSSKVAGVCDIGMKYKENQDYMALGTAGGALVLVVCDGVSTSQTPMPGSKAAAETGRDLILADVKTGVGEPGQTLKRALVGAHEAILK